MTAVSPPVSRENGAEIVITGTQPIFVERQRDALLIYAGDGTKSTFRLPPGEAKRLWAQESLGYDLGDGVPKLREKYGM